MCLILRDKNSNRPYNKRLIRYKVLSKGYSSNILYSPYLGNRWKTNVTYKATGIKYGKGNYGFHVYVKKNAARNYCASGSQVIVSLKVHGFLHSGTYVFNKCETWKYARIVKVETKRGKKNIIKQFE